MFKFDHVGITTTEKKENEFYYEPNKVWITDSETHPFHIEWLRYEPDSPVIDMIRKNPHIGYCVDSLKDVNLEGLELILGPMIIDEHKIVAFYKYMDGSIIELMENH